MSPWDTFLEQLGLLSTAIVGIVLATIGDFTRLLHEQERGGPKVGLHHVPGSMLRGTLMGVIAVSISEYLHSAYGVPKIAGGGIGGALGYLGPSIINVGLQWILDHLPKKPDKK